MDDLTKAGEGVQRRLAWLEAILDSATEVSLLGKIVRNPALAPKSVADLLAKSDEAQIQRQNVEKFSRSVANLIDLVGNILDLSNIESGQFELEKTEFLLQETVEQALGKVRPRAYAGKTALRFIAAPEIPQMLMGDPMRLKNLLANLVNNALTYSQSGEITVTAFKDAANPNRMCFSVCGNGIRTAGENPEAMLHDCVDRGRSVSCRPGRAWMGLGYCRTLASQMGSGLQIHTQPDGSTSFTFDVRLAEKTPQHQAPQLKLLTCIDEKAQTRAAHILIAEDSEDCRFLLQEFLKSRQYELTFAENGRRALEIAQSRRFDLILMDIQMPVMDGLTATRLIREAEVKAGRPAVPILALTANSRKADFDLSLAAGCNAHVRKPVSKIHLLKTIQQHLALHAEPSGLEDVA